MTLSSTCNLPNSYVCCERVVPKPRINYLGILTRQDINTNARSGPTDVSTTGLEGFGSEADDVILLRERQSPRRINRRAYRAFDI
jgi:hypothetical protein